MTGEKSKFPRSIGGFRVLDYLGSGGMGKVYLAESPGGNKVAIKVLPEYFSTDARALAQFRSEVQHLRQVTSSNVAQFIAAGEDNGSPWLATEYVDGQSLKARIDASGPLTGQELKDFARALLIGLADIHEAGIVHGDVKPENVLIAKNGEVKLIDLGISQTFGQTVIDRTGTFAGSPEWMSPEAFESSALEASADIFSAAAVIVFAGSGRSPWAKPNEKLNLAIAMNRITGSEPDLSGMDPEMQNVLVSMMNKTAKLRPTAVEVGQVLEIQSPTPKRKSKLKTAPIVLALVMALLISGVAFVLSNSPSGQPDEVKDVLTSCAEVRYFKQKESGGSYVSLADNAGSELLSSECSEVTTKFEIELCTVMGTKTDLSTQTISLVNKTSRSEVPLIWDPKTDYLGCRSFDQLGVHVEDKSIGYLRQISAHPLRIEQKQTEYLEYADGAGGLFLVRLYFPNAPEVPNTFIYAADVEPQNFRVDWAGEIPSWASSDQDASDFFTVTDQGIKSTFCWTKEELDQLDDAGETLRYESPINPDLTVSAPFEDISCGDGFIERSALLPLPVIYGASINGTCVPFTLVFPAKSELERRFEFCVEMG